MCPGPHQNQGWGWRRKTDLSPPVKYFTDRSKVVLLLWIFYFFFLSCVCYAFVRVCLYVPCGHLLVKWLTSWLSFVVSNCAFVTCVCHVPIGIIGQVWYLIVSIPNLCTLTYFIHCRLLSITYTNSVSQKGNQLTPNYRCSGSLIRFYQVLTCFKSYSLPHPHLNWHNFNRKHKTLS